MALRTTITLNGDRILLRKLSSVKPSLSEAQRAAGNELGNEILQEARNIIEQNTTSSGLLKKSLDVMTVKKSGGWNTKVFIRGKAKEYGYKVEGGWGPEKIKVTPEFIKWAELAVGKKFAKSLRNKKTYTVRKGNNPRYDTRTGMKFLQKPFDKRKTKIFTRYQDHVKEALKKNKL